VEEKNIIPVLKIEPYVVGNPALSPSLYLLRYPGPWAGGDINKTNYSEMQCTEEELCQLMGNSPVTPLNVVQREFPVTI
jgi:hypothetical protein